MSSGRRVYCSYSAPFSKFWWAVISFLQCALRAMDICERDLTLGGVYMIHTSVSFIPVRNLISYHVYMEVIVPEWHKVSCEPSFLQAILKRCYPSRHVPYLSQSTRSLISHRNETSYLLYMVPVQNVVRFHTSTKVSYQYENQSELVPEWPVPVQHFVRVSCKPIQSYKWAPGWTLPVWPVPVRHFVRVSCKPMQSYKWAPGWTLPVWLVPVQHFVLVSCKPIQSYK